jgi:hypothetical protein
MSGLIAVRCAWNWSLSFSLAGFEGTARHVGCGCRTAPFLAGGVAQLVGGKRKECTDPTRLPATIMPVDRENKGNRTAINGLIRE